MVGAGRPGPGGPRRRRAAEGRSRSRRRAPGTGTDTPPASAARRPGGGRSAPAPAARGTAPRLPRLGHFTEVILDRRPPARLPGGLEAVAHRLHPSAQRGRAVPSSVGVASLMRFPPRPRGRGSLAACARRSTRRSPAARRSRRWSGPPSSRPPPTATSHPQAVEQSPALVGHQGGELGGGLRAEASSRFSSACSQSDRPQAPRRGLAGLAARQVDGLAHGDDEQELPEVVAVLEPWERPRRAGV